MEHENALKAIHDLTLTLLVEGDIERVRKGLEIIHELSKHKTVAQMQSEIDGFNHGGDKDPGQHTLGRVGGTPLSSDPLS